MNTLLRTLLAAGLCTAGLSLAACGGGSNEEGDNGSGNGAATTTTSGGSASTDGAAPTGGIQNEEVAAAAQGLVEKFVGHIANREFAQALEMVAEGGGAEDLDGYLRALTDGTPAFQNMVSGLIDEAVAPFAGASIEIVETTDTTAVARLTMGEGSHDLNLNTLDGTSWLIEFPRGVIAPWESMMPMQQQP